MECRNFIRLDKSANSFYRTPGVCTPDFVKFHYLLYVLEMAEIYYWCAGYGSTEGTSDFFT